MIDKDKLIEAVESSETELSRETIEWLVENAEKFTGKFAKPYEVCIDFGPLFIGIFTNINVLSEKVLVLEEEVKRLCKDRQKETSESIEQADNRIDPCCE